jgi:hypothetical protein
MSDNQPQWLNEIGRRAQVRVTGRPVPPISGSVSVAKELDEKAAAVLEQDFRTVIDQCDERDEVDVNGRILDAMTANRLSSKQAVRLLRALFKKIDGGPGFQRVDDQGELHDVNRWGAA